jgi:hypothetical protein
MGLPGPGRALSTHNIQKLARKISLNDKVLRLPVVLHQDMSMTRSGSGAGIASGSASTPPTESTRESMVDLHIEAVLKEGRKRNYLALLPFFPVPVSFYCCVPFLPFSFLSLHQ